MLSHMANVEILRCRIPSCEISIEEAKEAVQYKVDAALEHNIAERLEDEGRQKESDTHWEKVVKLNEEYYLALLQHAD